MSNYRSRYQYGYRPGTGYCIGAYPDGVSSVSPLIRYSAQNIDGANNSSLSDGQTLGTWINLGTKGAAANVVQATAGLRPFFRLTADAGKINNLSAVDNNATRFMVATAFAAIPQPNIVAIVFKTLATSVIHTLFDGALGSNCSIAANDTVSQYSGVAYNPGQSIAANVWEMNITTFNGTTSQNRLNRVSGASGNCGANTITNAALFALTGGTTIANAMIAECAVYDITASIPQIEQDLSGLYGITPQ